MSFLPSFHPLFFNYVGNNGQKGKVTVRKVVTTHNAITFTTPSPSPRHHHARPHNLHVITMHVRHHNVTTFTINTSSLYHNDIIITFTTSSQSPSHNLHHVITISCPHNLHVITMHVRHHNVITFTINASSLCHNDIIITSITSSTTTASLPPRHRYHIITIITPSLPRRH
jgi:hypothetical protein